MDIQTIGSPAQFSPVLSGSASPPAPKTAAPTELVEAVPAATAAPDAQQLKQAVETINQAMQLMSLGVEFSIDDDSQRTIVRIVDQQTQEVLRQMPSEEALAISKALDKLQGLLVSQQA